MSFLDATLEALRGFAGEVATWTNQGSLVSIEGHIAQIENAAAEDLHAGETAAKAVWADLYAAFHGHHPAAPAPQPEPPTVTEAPAGSAAADPTPAPSTTTEASSAPSSTPSDSTTDTAPDAQ